MTMPSVNGSGGAPAGPDDWEARYRGVQPPPWEIGGPQPALLQVIDGGILDTVGARVLDVGCGTGDLAIALAARGYEVLGVEISPTAIAQAREKAQRAGVRVHFEVQDATNLSLSQAPFDALVDSGLLHNLHRADDTAAVRRYLAQLPSLVAPGGVAVILAIALDGTQPWGMTEADLRDAFGPPTWTDTRVDACSVAARVGDEDLALPGLLLRAFRRPA